MQKRICAAPLIVIGATLCSGCGLGSGSPGSDSTRSAAIVGNILAGGAAAKSLLAAQAVGCPDVVLTLNGSPVVVVFDDDCSFLINNVEPSERVVLRVELPELGIGGTVEIHDVGEADLIEINVEASDESLSVVVVRRVSPESVDEIPEIIDDSNVTLQVSAGLYEQNLTVLGNNYTLIGEAGDGCDTEGWSVVDGEVLINGNGALFRNIAFEGTVEIRGNDTTFINCCFDGAITQFGNEVEMTDE